MEWSYGVKMMIDTRLVIKNAWKKKDSNGRSCARKIDPFNLSAFASA